MENKYEYFERLKEIFLQEDIMVGEVKEISFGLQFKVEIDAKEFWVRIFESKKKGIKCDLSQVKDNGALELLSRLTGAETERNTADSGAADIEENGLIGTDESGKGDFFGPLVVAGVYADAALKKRLRELGAADSKKLSDARIAKLAKEISALCPHSIIVIGNQRYNGLYASIGNLNRLLAWGHARAIENVLNQVECDAALSDQFGNPALIKSALMKKGRSIILEQRPRAEENVVVAAASILARNEYVERMKALSEKYGVEFPKGASGRVLETGRKFVERFGAEALADAAKLHFKTARQILGGEDAGTDNMGDTGAGTIGDNDDTDDTDDADDANGAADIGDVRENV